MESLETLRIIFLFSVLIFRVDTGEQRPIPYMGSRGCTDNTELSLIRCSQRVGPPEKSIRRDSIPTVEVLPRIHGKEQASGNISAVPELFERSVDKVISVDQGVADPNPLFWRFTAIRNDVPNL